MFYKKALFKKRLLYWKMTLTQMFSSEYCEMFTYFEEYICEWTAASVSVFKLLWWVQRIFSKMIIQEEEQCIATKIWNFPIIIWQLFKECSFYCCLVTSTLLNFKRSNHHFYCIFPTLCFSKNRHRRCSVKNVFLKISQYSKKNTCVGVSF